MNGGENTWGGIKPEPLNNKREHLNICRILLSTS